MEDKNAAQTSRFSLLVQIIVFNTIPLVGVLFLKWDARLLIFSYFMETIIALLFHAVRLWYVNWRWGDMPETKRRAAEMAGGNNFSASTLPLFMLALYGFFCVVQLFVLGGFAEKAFPEGIFSSLYKAVRNELAWALISFSFLQLSRLLTEVIQGKYQYAPSETLFFQPFRRILIQQLTVILGGFFMLFGGISRYVIVLALVNLALDLLFFFIGNKKAESMVSPE